MDEPPPTHHENTALLRVKALLGSAVRLERRALRTFAGGKRGLLVYGYRVVRGGAPEEDGDAEVLGISPPAGSHIDLSRLGSPEEALQDALRRRRENLGPLEASEGRDEPRQFETAAANPADRPPRPHWKPSTESTTSGFSTSSLDLPVG